MFVVFHRFSWVFMNFRRFSSAFVDFLRFSSMFFDVLRFSPIFVEIQIFLSVFADFCRFSLKLRSVFWDGGPGTATPFKGGTPCPLPRGDLPPRAFLPRPRSSAPPGRWRRGTPRKHNTTTTRWRRAGSRAIIAPKELWLILSGIPLSLTKDGRSWG